jgi:cytochrome c oxidase assembly factor CtaG
VSPGQPPGVGPLRNALRNRCAVLANILIWTATPLYPAYRAGESISGISPLTDQQIGGGVMLIWGAFVTVALFSWLFLRWVGEGRVASVAS